MFDSIHYNTNEPSGVERDLSYYIIQFTHRCLLERPSRLLAAFSCGERRTGLAYPIQTMRPRWWWFSWDCVLNLIIDEQWRCGWWFRWCPRMILRHWTRRSAWFSFGRSFVHIICLLVSYSRESSHLRHKAPLNSSWVKIFWASGFSHPAPKTLRTF